MKISVVGEFEAGSHRAHAINVVKTAGGFVRLGHQVTLTCFPPTDAGLDPASVYAEPAIRWQYIAPGPEFTGSALAGVRSFAPDMLYARSFKLGAAGARAGIPTVLETHAHIGDTNPLLLECLCLAGPNGPLHGVVTISESLRAHFISRGAAPDRVHTVPDGVDLDLFARPSLLPPSPWDHEQSPRAVYAGHLYEYKGIPTILRAAALTPDWSFELLGGTPDDQNRTRASITAAGLNNVTVHGAVPHAHVPPWLWHADALLLPPEPDDPSALWTSPVKLGEYLASGTPIIASDIPGLKSWVAEPAVRWFVAGDPVSLSDQLRRLGAASDADRTAARIAARETAERFCYPRRAEQILRAGAVA